MSLISFIKSVTDNDPISFDETMAVIAENYHYQATPFNNGLNQDLLINLAGTNEGSCKVFSFAQIHGFDQLQTLRLFGAYYLQDVLNDPDGSGHPNIRNFMKYGWAGICFDGVALTAK